jgi:hypothetical protein
MAVQVEVSAVLFLLLGVLVGLTALAVAVETVVR